MKNKIKICYQVFECIIFVIAIILAIIICININIFSEQLIEQAQNEDDWIEAFDKAISAGIISASKYNVCLMFACVIFLFSIIGVAINYSINRIWLDWTICFAAFLYIAIFLGYICISSIKSGTKLDPNFKLFIESLELGFKFGFRIFP